MRPDARSSISLSGRGSSRQFGRTNVGSSRAAGDGSDRVKRQTRSADVPRTSRKGNAPRSSQDSRSSRANRSAQDSRASRISNSPSTPRGSRSSRSSSAIRGSSVSSSSRRASRGRAGEKGSSGRARGSGGPAGRAGYGRGITRFLLSNRAFLVALVVVGALLLGFFADLALNWGRVYPGVHVGAVDLSGATEAEARSLLEEAYAQSLSEGSVAVCASEEVAHAAREEAGVPLSERSGVTQALDAGELWLADAASLGAQLDTEGLVADALAVGRENGGLAARLQALFSSHAIAVRACYDDAKLEEFAASIDAAIGDPLVDFGMAVDDGVAYVTEGHDGVMIDRGDFALSLDKALLEDGGGVVVANPQHASVRISQESAQAACDETNAILSQGARLLLADSAWNRDAANLGAWVSSRAEETAGGFALVPCIDAEAAACDIQAWAMEILRGGLPAVSFAHADGGVVVRTDGTGEMPLSKETALQLDEALFGQARLRLLALADGNALADSTGEEPASALAEDSTVALEVLTQPTPKEMTFDEAYEAGLVEKISSYTTEYLNSESSANRCHNIHLAADKLNDSIVSGGGGVWSFYETTGECDEEAGFLGAGVIIEGEHDDAVGGGICQVATTVFNAVYESGFPVVRRYNHTLYLSNYPDGRDAAVNWPDLDLRWENDCASDVLLRCTYTDTSLTVTLYGVDPGYEVSTKMGDWQEGEAYKIRLKCDESLDEGDFYLAVSGVNASSISVYRTVRDRDGNVVREDVFSSHYQPEDEIVMAAAGTKIAVGEEVLVATPGKTVTSKGSGKPALAKETENAEDAEGIDSEGSAEDSAGSGDSGSAAEGD